MFSQTVALETLKNMEDLESEGLVVLPLKNCEFQSLFCILVTLKFKVKHFNSKIITLQQEQFYF